VYTMHTVMLPQVKGAVASNAEVDIACKLFQMVLTPVGRLIDGAAT